MIGLYAGSFDPPTRGHLWMIQEALTVCERLVIGVGNNPAKTPAFTLDQRVQMLETMRLNELSDHADQILITSFPNEYLARFMKRVEADVLFRGLRGQADFEHERTLHRMNTQIDESVKTLYLIPPAEIAEISSSTVRNLVGFHGWPDVISHYLPKSLTQNIISHYSA